MLNLDDPDLVSGFAMKSIMGLDGLKDAFVCDFDDEFNGTSLVCGIAVHPQVVAFVMACCVSCSCSRLLICVVFWT
jgi:hypothetical protein